jgi:hypothetical protein
VCKDPDAAPDLDSQCISVRPADDPLLEALAASDDKARRLMMIPRIGPRGATALHAAASNYACVAP